MTVTVIVTFRGVYKECNIYFYEVLYSLVFLALLFLLVPGQIVARYISAAYEPPGAGAVTLLLVKLYLNAGPGTDPCNLNDVILMLIWSTRKWPAYRPAFNRSRKGPLGRLQKDPKNSPTDRRVPTKL